MRVYRQLGSPPKSISLVRILLSLEPSPEVCWVRMMNFFFSRNWNEWKWLPEWTFLCAFCFSCSSNIVWLEVIFLAGSKLRCELHLFYRSELIAFSRRMCGKKIDDKMQIHILSSRRDETIKQQRSDNLTSLKCVLAARHNHWINCNGILLHSRHRCKFGRHEKCI